MHNYTPGVDTNSTYAHVTGICQRGLLFIFCRLFNGFLGEFLSFFPTRPRRTGPAPDPPRVVRHAKKTKSFTGRGPGGSGGSPGVRGTSTPPEIIFRKIDRNLIQMIDICINARYACISCKDVDFLVRPGCRRGHSRRCPECSRACTTTPRL